MSSVLPGSTLGASVFCQVFVRLPQSPAESFSVASVYAGCTLVCHVRASLFSAGKAMGSPLAGRASTVTLLAAGVAVSVGIVLWAGPYGLQCLQAEVSLADDQYNFARDVP